MRTPIMTRIPLQTKSEIKNLSIFLNYKNIRSMCEHLFNEFLNEKPYKNNTFVWKNPAKKSVSHWTIYNVVLTDEQSELLKKEAFKLEVALSTFLYSGIDWWLQMKRPEITSI